MSDNNEIERLSQQLEGELVEIYGHLLTNDSLEKLLLYPSKEAFRKAVTRKQVPVPLFKIPNRHGRFALTKDVARYLATQRCLSSNSLEEEK